MVQIGSHVGSEVEILVEHDNTVLAELTDVNYELDRKGRPGGAGLGTPKNTYHKFGVPEGSWGLSRNMLKEDDKGMLFLDLLKGSGYIITEPIANAATTHTTAKTLVHILEIRLVASDTELDVTDDYTVNYATDTITFNSALTEAAEIKYVSTDMLAENLLENGGFEDVITNIWEAEATGTPSQDSANEYVGTYGGKVLAPAQNDGIKYVPDIAVVPNRTYKLRFAVKGTDTETFKAQWTDAGGTSDMTVVGSAGTLSGAAWQVWEYTFTPDEATILDIKIINTTAIPHTFYLDEVYLAENDPNTSVLDGANQPFQFNVVWRRKSDGLTIRKLGGCAVYTGSGKSGEGEAAYTEEFGGSFLDFEGEA